MTCIAVVIRHPPSGPLLLWDGDQWREAESLGPRAGAFVNGRYFTWGRCAELGWTHWQPMPPAPRGAGAPDTGE